MQQQVDQVKRRRVTQVCLTVRITTLQRTTARTVTKMARRQTCSQGHKIAKSALRNLKWPPLIVKVSIIMKHWRPSRQWWLQLFKARVPARCRATLATRQAKAQRTVKCPPASTTATNSWARSLPRTSTRAYPITTPLIEAINLREVARPKKTSNQ